MLKRHHSSMTSGLKDQYKRPTDSVWPIARVKEGSVNVASIPPLYVWELVAAGERRNRERKKMARGGRSLRRVAEYLKQLPNTPSREIQTRNNVRYLSSCGILMTRVPPLLGAAMPGRVIVLPARSFFNLTDSFSKRKEYSERRIIGYVSSFVALLMCRFLK
ncbi:hypothetical protein XENORESO_007358 [Xenotaenia resolanae]|uniref:Uncharacterized protein n=1 Tax=Xenotaenia resolanae TaxID=208358 RepID=A0ABV0WKE5_9TELE